MGDFYKVLTTNKSNILTVISIRVVLKKAEHINLAIFIAVQAFITLHSVINLSATLIGLLANNHTSVYRSKKRNSPWSFSTIVQATVS